MITVLLVSLMVSSCWFPLDQRDAFIGDLLPPQLLSYEMTEPKKIELTFDRPAEAEPHQLNISGDRNISSVHQDCCSLFVTLSTSPGIGERFILQGTFRGSGGSTLQLSLVLYGYNPNPAGLIINELTTRGSDNHPDRIEFLVTSSGNTGGITCYDGTPQEYRQHKVFPAVEVEQGSYIILHASGDCPSRQDELSHTSESSAPGTHDEAWDFFMHEGMGFSSNNGVITLTDTPQGALIDGLFYSNRNSDSDERYRGFGSTSMLQQVMRLCRMGGWDADADTVRPEDGIPSTYSTATRSMSRLPGSYTRHKRDWITVPTRGATFGCENMTQPYVPDP